MEKKILDNLTQRINATEEKIKYKDNTEKYYAKLANAYPSLKDQDEYDLFIMYIRTKNTDIKDIIYKCHLKDVYTLCKDDTGYRLDLISEGYTLLYQIIDLYDPRDYDISFKTYAKLFLATLYERKIRENEEDLNTEISLEKLKNIEERDLYLNNIKQKLILKKEEEISI